MRVICGEEEELVVCLLSSYYFGMSLDLVAGCCILSPNVVMLNVFHAHTILLSFCECHSLSKKHRMHRDSEQLVNRYFKVTETFIFADIYYTLADIFLVFVLCIFHFCFCERI